MINIKFNNVKWNYILLYIFPLSLVFYATLCQFYGQTNFLFELLLRTRAISVILFSLFGFIITKRFSGKKLSRVVLFFSVYCFLTTILVSYPKDIKIGRAHV